LPETHGGGNTKEKNGIEGIVSRKSAGTEEVGGEEEEGGLERNQF